MLPVLIYRQRNLRNVVKNFTGGLQKIAEVLGYANGSFMSQMLSDHATRKVTEKSARAFEDKLGLEPMSLDQPVDAPEPTAYFAPAEVVKAPVNNGPLNNGPLNTDLMVTLIDMVCGEFAAEGVTLVPAKLSSALEMALLDAVEHANIARPEYIKRLVKMLK